MDWLILVYTRNESDPVSCSKPEVCAQQKVSMSYKYFSVAICAGDLGRSTPRGEASLCWGATLYDFSFECLYSKPQATVGGLWSWHYVLPGNDFSKKCRNCFADCFAFPEKGDGHQSLQVKCVFPKYQPESCLLRLQSLVMDEACIRIKFGLKRGSHLREEFVITSENGYWHSVQKGTAGKWLGFFIFADKVWRDSWTRLVSSDREGRVACLFPRLAELSPKCKFGRNAALDRFLLCRRGWSRIPS